MARSNKSSTQKSSFLHNPLFIVLGLVFGLIALLVVYQGVKTSLETRSLAAQQSYVYKRWNFTNTAEGWVGPTSNSVNGNLVVAIGLQTASITNNSVNTKMPKGNKYITLRMSVSPVAMAVDVSKTGPKPSVRKFSYTLTYWLNGEEDRDSPGRSLTVRGQVDGKMHEYRFLLGNITASTVSKLTLRFDSGVKAGDSIQIDSITLSGPVPPAPPAPQGGGNPNRSPGGTTTAPGCYYQPVQCVQAPCNPILVCPTVTRAPTRVPTSAACVCPGTSNDCPSGDVGLCPESIPTSMACAQDVFICPDGSAVPRYPPECNFGPCPTTDQPVLRKLVCSFGLPMFTSLCAK